MIGRMNRSERAFVIIAGALVIWLLFVTLNPEARLFLMFIDSFGADLFATLCILYVRDHLSLCIALLIIPILKGIYRWGPVPGFWPSKIILKSSVSWAGYAVLYPAASLCVAALIVRCALSGLAAL
jgi:hypothetical protein